jgi:hypothetical protein
MDHLAVKALLPYAGWSGDVAVMYGVLPKIINTNMKP